MAHELTQSIQRGPWNSSPRGWKSPCDMLNYEVTTVKFVSVITFSSAAACEFCRHGYGDTRSLAMSTGGPWSCRVSISAASLPLTTRLTLARQPGLYFLGGDQFWTQRASTGHKKAGRCWFWCDFRQHCDISVAHPYYWWVTVMNPQSAAPHWFSSLSPLPSAGD